MTDRDLSSEARLAFSRLALLIDGQWLDAQQRRGEPVLDPASEDALGVLPHATLADLDRAAEAAQRAFQSWSRTTATERRKYLLAASALLRERAEKIAHILSLEQGKPLAEARAELTGAIEIFEWYAEEVRRLYGRTIPPRAPNVLQTVSHEPIGPVAAFTPWNFPALTPARKIAGALAAGCTLVIKPAEETPGTAIELARACVDAGVPEGVLNVVFGVPHEISETLIRHSAIRKVTFTGSIPVGKQLAELAAAHGLKPCTLELGGHAPVLVCADADIAHAAQACAAARYRNAGQVCVAASRFYVQHEVHDAFVEAFSAAADALTVGGGLEAETTMGPLTNQRRLDAMSRYVNDARERNAQVHRGGERLARPGWFFAPTVISGLGDDALAMREETFGPVAAISSFDDLDEGISRANALPYGLAAYAFTQSARTSERIARDLRAGMIGINHFAVSLAEAPFGGVGESGYGSEGGSEGLHAYLTPRFVTRLLM